MIVTTPNKYFCNNVKPVVAHVNTVGDPAVSTAKIMHGICDNGKATDFSFFTVAGFGRLDDADYLLERRWAYRLNAGVARLTGNDGFGAEAPTRRLLEILDARRPDLVHLHNAHGYYLNLPMLTRWLRSHSVPLVITLHDWWLLTGRCAKPQSVDCDLWQRQACDQCQHREAYPACWLNNVPLYKDALFDGIEVHLVAPLAEVADDVRRSALSRFPISVIEHGVDKRMFNQEGPAINLDGGVRLLAASTKWTHAKGVDRLLEFAEHMPQGWHLNIVGRGWPHATRTPRIRVCGYAQTPEQMAAYYRGVDILLSASRAETFGLTLYEANACGTLCATINDDVTASICRVSDALASKAVKNVRDIQLMAREYHDLYASILAKHAKLPENC